MNLMRLKAASTLELTAWTVAVAGLTGIVAGPATASAAVSADKTSHRAVEATFKRPTLKHGLLTITGTAASDKITLRLKADAPGVLQVDVGDNGSADFSFRRRAITKIAVGARAGNDQVRIDESNGAFTDTIKTNLSGGRGRDTLLGGIGAETLRGGDGNDTIDGNGGNDRALMGAGGDTFVWDPGDGSDTIKGQDGVDTMRFNGADAAEQVTLSASANRLAFFRDLGNINMSTAGVERVDFNALGGADVVTVNDLTGTDVTDVNVDLASAIGGTAGDGQADRVVVNATNGDDTINVNGDTGGIKASGLAATVEIQHSEAANDRLEVNTLTGTDTVDSSGLVPGAIQLFVDGVLVA